MYDIIVLETSVFVRRHVNDKLAVLKVHSGDRFLLVPEKAVFVWTEGLKYPDARGQGLKFLQANVTALRV